VPPSLSQALKLGLVEVVLENGLVVRVSALVNDNPGTLARRHAADVGETLLGNDNVEIMLGLVDVCDLGQIAGYSGGIVLGGAGGGCVHDRVFGGAQEIG
jgi:hypothetical protein